MAIAEAAAPRFEIGRVINRTFNVIRNNLATFAMLSLVPGLASVATDWADNQLEEDLAALTFPASDTLFFLAAAWLVYIASWFVLQAAVVYNAVAALNGKRASVGDCLAIAFRNIVPLVLMGTLATVGILAGLLLLILPGFVVAVMWVVIVPAYIVENTGILGAFKRSRELTLGYRGRIFGLCLIYFIVMILIGALLGIAALVASPQDFASSLVIIQMISGAISAMIGSIAFSTLIASLYYELRQIKEGIGPEALAAVFD
jgi:hypothetical protein